MTTREEWTEALDELVSWRCSGISRDAEDMYKRGADSLKPLVLDLIEALEANSACRGCSVCSAIGIKALDKARKYLEIKCP